MAITINGTGTITGLSAGGLPDGSVTAADLATTLDLSSNTVTLPSGTGGKILQVQYASHKTTASTSCANNTRVVLTTFGVTITPSSTSSKIIVSMQLTGSWSASNCPHEGASSLSRRIGGTDYIFGLDDVSDYTAPSNRNLGLSTAQVSIGNNTGTNIHSYIISNFQDSPSTTSAITYYPVVRQTVGSTQTFYHNRTGSDTDNSNNERGTCWMMAMEVAA